MKKSEIKLTLYNLNIHSEEFDRLLPINDKDQILELKDNLPPSVGVIEYDTSLNVNYTYISNLIREIKIPKGTFSVFNYVVMENKSNSTFNKKTTYWFANQKPDNSKAKDNFELKLDSFATFGEEFFSLMENKLTEWSKRHIDRWVPNPETEPVIWKYSLWGYKKPAAQPASNLSFVDNSFSNKQDIINAIKAVNSNWLTNYNQLGRLSWGSSTDSDSPITREDINDRVKFEVTDDKIIITREYDQATRTLQWVLIPFLAGGDVLDIHTLSDWKLTSSTTESKLSTSISLPNNSGKLWTKKDIEEWVAQHYRGAIITTDLTAFLADSTKHSTSDIEIKNNKYNQTYSVFGDIRFTKISKPSLSNYEGSAIFKYQTEQQIKESLASLEGVSPSSISLRTKTGDNFTSGEYQIQLVSETGAVLPARAFTYGDYIKQTQIKTHSQHEFLRHLTEEVYISYALVESNFLSEINITLPEEQSVLGYTKEELKKALNFFVNQSSTLPSNANYVWSYTKSGLPKGIEKIEYVNQSNDNNRGRKIISVKVFPNKKHNIINSDKTNELWQNREFPKLLETEGATTHQKPINLLPTLFGKQQLEQVVDSIPYKDILGYKQRVFYAIASKLMMNKLTHISNNDYYVFAVVSSTKFTKVKETFVSDNLDLSKVYNLEEPFVFVPIINTELETLIESAEKITNSSAKETALKKIFNDYVLPSTGVIDKVSGYQFKNALFIDQVYQYFKNIVVNNTHKKIKSKFGESIIKVSLSPIPLSQRKPSSISNLKDGQNLIDTYFNVVKTGNLEFLALKSDYQSLSDFIELDFREIDLNDEFTLGENLPEYLNLNYIERNIEVALLNTTYEKHFLKTLLSTSQIALDPRHYYSNSNFIIQHKMVQGGVDYDMRFKNQQSEPIFYEQKFSLPFAINEGLKVLQQQREQNQARLDEIRRNHRRYSNCCWCLSRSLNSTCRTIKFIWCWR